MGGEALGRFNIREDGLLYVSRDTEALRLDVKEYGKKLFCQKYGHFAFAFISNHEIGLNVYRAVS